MSNTAAEQVEKELLELFDTSDEAMIAAFESAYAREIQDLVDLDVDREDAVWFLITMFAEKRMR